MSKAVTRTGRSSDTGLEPSLLLSFDDSEAIGARGAFLVLELCTRSAKLAGHQRTRSGTTSFKLMQRRCVSRPWWTCCSAPCTRQGFTSSCVTHGLQSQVAPGTWVVHQGSERAGESWRVPGMGAALSSGLDTQVRRTTSSWIGAQ